MPSIRKNKESTLKAADRGVMSEKAYSLIFSRYPDPVFIISKEGRFVYCNSKAVNQTRYRLSEIRGKHFSKTDLFDSRTLTRLKKVFSKIEMSRSIASEECKLICNNNKKKLNSGLSIVPLLRGGLVELIVLLVKDVGKRKVMEKGSRRYEEEYKMLFENVPDPILILDRWGRFLIVNKRFLELVGYEEGELVGKHFSEVGILHPNDVARALKSFYENMGGLETGPDEYEIFKNDGSKRIVEVKATPLLKGDELRSVIEIVRDVTERKGLEQELRESEQRYKTLVEAANDAIISTKIDGKIIHFSKRAEELFGYSREEMIGKSVFILFAGFFRREQERLCNDFLKGKDLSRNAFFRNIEVLGIRKDGSEVDSEVSISLFGERENVVSVIIIRDITERKLLERRFRNYTGELEKLLSERTKELRQSEEKYQGLIEMAYDSIISVNEKLEITGCNQRTEHMFGFSQNEILGELLTFLIPQRKQYLKVDKDESSQTEGQIIEAVGLRKDKTEFPVEMSFSISKIDEGYQALAILRDITERKRIEEVLRERNKELHALNEISKAVGETLDLDELLKKVVSLAGSIVDSNYTSIVVVDEEGVLKKSYDDFHGIPLLHIRAREKGITRRIVSTGLPVIVDRVPDDTQDNQTNPDLITHGIKSYAGVPIISQGKLRGVLFVHSTTLDAFKEKIPILSAFARQIAPSLENAQLFEKLNAKTRELISINRKLEKAYENLKITQNHLVQVEKLRALGEMAGGVAHDFNNILAAILGRSELLKIILERYPGPERRKSKNIFIDGLEVIEKAASDGAETVRRIQEFTRVRTDDKLFTKVDVNGLVNDAMEFTKTKWMNEAEASGIKIKVRKRLGDNLPVLGNVSELREVLINMIMNSIDAMPEGGNLSIKTKTQDKKILISIRDNGMGMSDVVKQKIFDPFFTTKGPQSTGLGMSVSYGIIKRHKGEILVESKEGKGTTMSIILPVSLKSVESEKKEWVAVKCKKASILVVDDDREICSLLHDILKNEGHEVVTASTGIKGISAFKKNHFDLVISDLGMPKMSGWEVAKEIKKMNPEIPVVILNGWGVQLDDEKLKENRVDLVMAKPFKVSQVLDLVHQTMESKGKIH